MQHYYFYEEQLKQIEKSEKNRRFQD